MTKLIPELLCTVLFTNLRKTIKMYYHKFINNDAIELYILNVWQCIATEIIKTKTDFASSGFIPSVFNLARA